MLKVITISIILLLSYSYISAESIKPDTETLTKKRKKTLSDKKLVVFISSSDLQKAGMGFSIALSGVKQGASVTVVIGADAVKFVLKDNKQNIYFAKERTPRELLLEAIKSGATVQMCSANTEQMGLDEDDFIKGVKVVISTEIFAKVFEKGTKVISF